MNNSFTVEKFLAEELKLSPKEIALYVNLIKHGSITVMELADISNINRATTHVNVENLIKKGLVTHVKKGSGSRRFIMAEPMEKLAIIFKERKAKLEAAENQLAHIAKELSGLKAKNKKNDGMEIRRYEGKDEVRLIYDDVLKAKEIRSYLNYKELIKVFPVNTSKFLEIHKKRTDMFMWEIMEDSKEARSYAKQTLPNRYFCKLTDKKINLTSLDYMMFDGKVAIIDLAKDVTGIVIENENFYENTRAIHNFVWQFLPDYKR